MKTFINPPETCDVCRKPFGDFMHDAPTTLGLWGCLCSACYLSIGRPGGQKYRKNAESVFEKIGNN